MDSIHLHKINKGRIQVIAPHPVVVFDFSILRRQVLGLALRLPHLFITNIRQTSNDCFVDREVFADCFQLKLNGLTNPYLKDNLSFTLHPTSTSHCTKLPEIFFHMNVKCYYPLTRKDKHPFSAALDPLAPYQIDLSWGIARIRIRSGSPCNWITCEQDTGAHVNTTIFVSIRIQVPM